MEVGDAVKLEKSNGEVEYGHIAHVTNEGLHVLVCLHNGAVAEAEFLTEREKVAA